VTGSDLIVLAPWIIFGAVLGAICARLYVSRSRARRRRALQRPERGCFMRLPTSTTASVTPPEASALLTSAPLARRPAREAREE
jgi:hypothetical protein